jgi:hypothetical protein
MPQGGEDMAGKKILAAIFAVLILVKLLVFLVSPGKWLGLAGVFLSHSAMVMGLYGVLIVVTGYYALSSMDLIDLAVVMFFTSLLMGLTLIPYSAALLKLSDEITAIGLGRAWYGLVLWGAIAVAVLYKVLARQKQ